MTTTGFPDWNINGVIPISTGTADTNGCYWWIDGDVAGWDSPDMRVSMLTKIGNTPTATGEIPADLHYRGRTLTFKLVAACPSEAAREKARDLLARATDISNGAGTFYVNEVVPKQVSFLRSGNSNQGKLTMAPAGLSQLMAVSHGIGHSTPGEQVYLLTAEVELHCQDPRKYGQAGHTVPFETNVATIPATQNNGNTPSQDVTIKLYVTGGGTGPITINVGGTTTQIKVPVLPLGATPLPPIPTYLILDLLAHTITDTAGTNYYYLRNCETPWPALPLGATTVTLSGSIGGDVPGEVLWTPAWI